MSARKRRGEQPNIYINIAPLVEVMLVLIIIFMITAPMMNVGVKVDLPKTKAAALDDSKSKPIIISIDKDSQLYVDETGVTPEELATQIPSLLEDRKSDTVYVRGDKELPYGEIMRIMGMISSLGVCKVSLIAELATDSGASPLPQPQGTTHPPSKETAPTPQKATTSSPSKLRSAQPAKPPSTASLLNSIMKQQSPSKASSQPRRNSGRATGRGIKKGR
ncbi:MAG: ExbD/TolR family protein [Holosporales bacterium]|jgi:biopolymer transport protein TolR|nr:ExbD/TolR family protein [Holosporales bacterium]